MVTYVVASKANNPYLAECQIAGEFLEQNVADVNVKFVIKDTKEWKEFIDSVCRLYGFPKKTCPIVYTIEGTYIGDGKEFLDHILQTYDKTITITNAQTKDRQKINVMDNDERVRKQKEGDTLGQKIEATLNKISKKKVTDLLEDAFYAVETEEGVPFQVKRTNFYRQETNLKLNYGRTYDIVDEELIRSIQMEKEQAEEAKKDLTWDGFLEQYLDHIEGKISPDERTANRPETAMGGPDAEAKTIEKSEAEESKRYQSIQSRGSDGKSAKSSKGGTAANEAAKYDLPNNCKLHMLSKSVIIKLDDNFMLAANPYPQIEGEMLLFQYNPDDQSPEIDGIVYRDYSLRKRLKPEVKTKTITASAVAKKKQLEEDAEKTKVQCLDISLTEPLSTLDWHHMSEIIKEIKAMAWIQFLPVGQKSSTPYQFNCMHILPNSKIPFTKIPLDKMISNKTTFMKKYTKQQNDPTKTNAKIHREVQTRDKEAGEQGLLLVDEYLFPHCVFPLTSHSDMTPDVLKQNYSKMQSFLGMNDLAQTYGVGATLIVTPVWMFLGVITQPYHVNPATEIPLYLDGFGYAGILGLQDIGQVWPATTGISHASHTVMESLHAQGQLIEPPEEAQ